MSLHSSHDDVEVRTPHAQPSTDARIDSNIELLVYPSDNSSVSSNSIVEIESLRSISRERLHVKIWTRVNNWFVNWWMGELLIIFWSFVVFSVLIFLLFQYDGHSLSTLPHNVPLNFVVSTLATVSKSSLLLVVASALGQFKWLWVISKQRRLQDLQDFDEASRGPLGAAKLLASKKFL